MANAEELPTKTYAEVRALDRGLALIETMSSHGWSSPARLAILSGMDRSTVYRLLATLVRCGYAVRREGDGNYALSVKLRDLASGVHVDDRLVGLVFPELESLVRAIHWPSDFAVLTGGRLRIMASTHHLTSWTFFRGLVGKERPIIDSALGRAILAALPEEDVDALIPTLLPDTASVSLDRADISRLIADTTRVGYSRAVSSVEHKISAIALPVMDADRVAGAINVVFFRSAMSTEQAAARYLGPLRECIARIEHKLVD